MVILKKQYVKFGKKKKQNTWPTKMAKFIVSWQAELNLREIFRYGFKSFGLEQAERFQIIANFPYHYISVDQIYPGYRRCAYRSH